MTIASTYRCLSNLFQVAFVSTVHLHGYEIDLHLLVIFYFWVAIVSRVPAYNYKTGLEGLCYILFGRCHEYGALSRIQNRSPGVCIDLAPIAAVSMLPVHNNRIDLVCFLLLLKFYLSRKLRSLM